MKYVWIALLALVSLGGQAIAAPLTMSSRDLGAPVPVDKIGNDHYKKFKLVFGADGSATDISALNPLPVTSAGGGSSAAPDGRAKVALITHDFSEEGGSVTDSAYTEILASSADIINYLDIWNESGSALYLAVGAAASEVDQIYIFPSGNDEPLRIPAASRLSIKSVSGTISTGLIRINALK